MTVKVRKQISIDRDQEERLKQLAADTGASEAEIVRQALDRALDAPDFPFLNDAIWAKEVEYIEALSAQGHVPGRRTWRREDAYEA